MGKVLQQDLDIANLYGHSFRHLLNAVEEKIELALLIGWYVRPVLIYCMWTRNSPQYFYALLLDQNMNSLALMLFNNPPEATFFLESH